MKDKLIEIAELMELLGCEDERTIVKWCMQKKMPLIRMGKKKYTLKVFLDLFIKDEMKKFVNARYENPDEIIEAIEQDDKVELAELIAVPVIKPVKKEFKEKANSKAADDYIKKFKIA